MVWPRRPLKGTLARADGAWFSVLVVQCLGRPVSWSFSVLVEEADVRGSDERRESLFSHVDVEARPRSDHPLRSIRALTDENRCELVVDARLTQSLLQNQYRSRLAYLQVQQQVVESQHELEGDRGKLEEGVQAIASLDRQKAETVAEYRHGLLTDLAKAEVSASEHGEELAKARDKAGLRTLRAPVDGTVQQLAVHTLGGVVTPAQPLMVVVPKGTGLEIKATLPNKDVGFVHRGQAVEVKVEAYTFTRYGLLHGEVASLSQDVVAPQDAAEDRHSSRDEADYDDEAKRQAGQPTYVVRVSLDATTIRTEDGISQLEPGMAVTAEIKTGRRTVISYLLSPLLRLRQEGLRER